MNEDPFQQEKLAELNCDFGDQDVSELGNTPDTCDFAECLAKSSAVSMDCAEKISTGERWRL